MKFIVHQASWRFSWPVRLCCAALLAAVAATVIMGAHDFLSPTKPVGGKVLVVEGWMPDYALADARERFEAGGYTFMALTGGELVKGFHLAEFKTHARMGRETLRAIGMPADQMVEIPMPPAIRNRTYVSAVAVRDWLGDRPELGVSFDVATLGPHAARTHLLYRYAFGDSAAIGIIAIPQRNYEPDRWWASSEGLRTMIGESIGWFYARFVFSPATD